MEELQDMKMDNTAPFLRTWGMNYAATHNRESSALFYSLLGSRYLEYYKKKVKVQLDWYDGYVPCFHNGDAGVLPTNIARGLISKIARKICGSQEKIELANKYDSAREVNESIKKMSEKLKDGGFWKMRKKCVEWSAANGFSLAVINKGVDGELWYQALRADQFVVELNRKGEVIDCLIILGIYPSARKLDNEKKEVVDAYYLVEHRHFGNYRLADGTQLIDAPLSRIEVIRNILNKSKSGNAVSYVNIGTQEQEKLEWNSLPKNIRKTIKEDYSNVTIGCDTLLPFSDYLGCEVINFTEGSNIMPGIPFGDGFLADCEEALQAYDYNEACRVTDSYLGRGRVVVSDSMQNPTDSNFNSGFDSFLFTQKPYVNGQDTDPKAIQFSLRTAEWTQARNHILENISVTTGINVGSYASFLNDTQTAKTAREISVEESDLLSFVGEKRKIIEKPLNILLDTIRRYYSCAEEVRVRWSVSDLINAYNRAEIANMGVNGGWMSKEQAIEMNNPDDGEEQLKAKYEEIMKESMQAFNPSDYFGEGVNEQQ